MDRINYPSEWPMDLDVPQDGNDRRRWGEIIHVPQGRILWNAERAELFRAPLQKASGSGGLFGRYIKNQVRQLPALNASALDFLLEQQHLIPESWRQFHLHFWGTIFQEGKGDQHVRCMYWHRTRWVPYDLLVDGYGWSDRSVAVLYPGVMPMQEYLSIQRRMRKRRRIPLCA